MNPADLQVLAARAAIHDVLVRNALTQDAHEWDAHGDTFAPDVVYTHPGGEILGAAAVVDRARRALGPLDANQHLLGTILVELDADGDGASTTTSFQATHIRHAADGGSRYTIAGTYRDRLSRGHDGAWQITHRHQTYSWRDGNPAVIIRPGGATP